MFFLNKISNFSNDIVKKKQLHFELFEFLAKIMTRPFLIKLTQFEKTGSTDF